MSDFIEVEQLPSSSELKAEDKVLINQNDDDTIVSLGELKEYCRPELATTTESGLVSTGEQSFSGKKTFTEVTTNKATVSNATIQNGNIAEATVENLRITGNLIQDGETVETEVETLKVQDQVIVTRSGATVGMGDGEYTGIKAEKYDGVNDGVLAFGPDGVARVGDEGSTQPLATREEAPTNNSLQIWDEQTQSLKSFPMGNKGQYLRQGENGLEYGSAVAVDEVQDYVDEQIQAEATLRQNAVETLDGKVNTNTNDIIGIQEELSNKSDTNHTHSNLVPFLYTSMTELGFTAGSNVSVKDFWNTLCTKIGKVGIINFGWTDANSAYVGTDANRVRINGGMLLFGMTSKPGAWQSFWAIFIDGGGSSNNITHINCTVRNDWDSLDWKLRKI